MFAECQSHMRLMAAQRRQGIRFSPRQDKLRHPHLLLIRTASGLRATPDCLVRLLVEGQGLASRSPNVGACQRIDTKGGPVCEVIHISRSSAALASHVRRRCRLGRNCALGGCIEKGPGCWEAPGFLVAQQRNVPHSQGVGLSRGTKWQSENWIVGTCALSMVKSPLLLLRTAPKSCRM
jgi:hypothetical protein